MAFSGYQSIGQESRHTHLLVCALVGALSLFAGATLGLSSNTQLHVAAAPTATSTVMARVHPVARNTAVMGQRSSQSHAAHSQGSAFETSPPASQPLINDGLHGMIGALAIASSALLGLMIGLHSARPKAVQQEESLESRITMAGYLGQKDAGLPQYHRLRTCMHAVATGDLGACHNGKFLTAEQKAELERICEMIGTPGKGITACDEGPATIGSRFEAVGIVNTEENRRAYRQMLFEAPGANKYLSAAILDPETVFQKSTSGKPFPEVLMELGIVPGVKPHLKVYELPGQSGSTVMQGLDSLAVRLREYAAAGCKFAKWRSPLIIDVANGQPSDMVIQANMNDLARYALICQAEGLVPIVEPDISMSGDHDLETAVYINVKVQSVLYKAMLDHGVFMEGSILKSNMVNPGKKCPIPYTVQDIAKANIDVFRRCMPVAIRSANFLSGGQSLSDAAARLSVINQIKGNNPWNLSFSWSAALQMPLFQLCKGKGQLCLPEMAELYLKELEIASAAARGEWVPEGSAGAHIPK